MGHIIFSFSKIFSRLFLIFYSFSSSSSSSFLLFSRSSLKFICVLSSTVPDFRCVFFVHNAPNILLLIYRLTAPHSLLANGLLAKSFGGTAHDPCSYLRQPNAQITRRHRRRQELMDGSSSWAAIHHLGPCSMLSSVCVREPRLT